MTYAARCFHIAHKLQKFIFCTCFECILGIFLECIGNKFYLLRIGSEAITIHRFETICFKSRLDVIVFVENADANGVTFTCAIPGPADPWEPASEDPADVAAKVDEVFGSESEVAAHVTTYAEYEALVTYIQSTTGAPATPDLLTEGQVDWMWKSYILGANPLFTTNVVVAITSLDANATAGKWDFVVKVTEGELTTAHSVVPAKVAALVKVTDSLSPASWDAPDPEDVHADLAPLLGTNLIKVTVDFGTDTSGFMKVSE